MTRLYSAGVMSVNWAKTEVKATLTHTSIGPRASRGLGGGRLDLIRVGDVGRYRQRRAARPLDVTDRAGQAGLAPGQQGDLGAAGGEGQCGGPADPAAGPGHHDDLPGMLVAHLDLRW